MLNIIVPSFFVEEKEKCIVYDGLPLSSSWSEMPSSTRFLSMLFRF